MNASTSAAAARDGWHRHFAETIVSADRAEVAAATEAAVAAIAQGEGEAAAKAAGRAAATAYRQTRSSPGRAAGRAATMAGSGKPPTAINSPCRSTASWASGSGKRSP